jgi:hypothetical protein
MRLWIAFLALLPACGFQAPLASGDGGGIDSPPDAPQLCFGSFVRVCFNTVADVPTDAKNMSAGADIDTDSQMQAVCDQQNDRKRDFCVIAGKGFVLATGQVLRAHGSKPLVLLSTDTMMLEATSMVDVSSTRMAAPQDRGAGANPSNCMAGMAPAMAGGGFGGSFGGKGGDGERLGGPATSGTAAGATATPTMLRGGCPGGDGDNTGGIGGGGAGGGGGGAVALVAATSIQILGTVNASGAGGHGGPTANKSGGGGGGSGGMIVIESTSITATGLVFANGGGGGQGGTGPGTPAVGGDGGESTAPATAGIGGAGSAVGGEGGKGSFGPGRIFGSPAANNSTGMGGGGAGGGGAGFIRGHGLPAAANIFPDAIDLP